MTSSASTKAKGTGRSATKRLPPGISRTPTGFRAQVRIRGVLHRQRFTRDTPISTMINWVAMIRRRYASPYGPGTFAADAERYLKAVRAMPTYTQRAQHIRDWVAVFGERYRDEITPDEIRAQLHAWRSEGKAAATCNKRRTALMHAYTVLDGRSGKNPVRDAPKFREPAPAPKALPYALIRGILDALPESKAKARLMVMAFTGLPQAQIETIRPEDVDFEAGAVAVQGRRKGAGTAGRLVPLTPDGVRAFKMMDREGAWGRFSRTVVRRAFQRACTRLGLPKRFVPYDLRHSFGTEVYRSSGDIRATQVLMGHSTPQLTHRYTLAAVDPRVKAALEQFGRAKDPVADPTRPESGVKR